MKLVRAMFKLRAWNLIFPPFHHIHIFQRVEAKVEEKIFRLRSEMFFDKTSTKNTFSIPKIFSYSITHH